MTSINDKCDNRLHKAQSPVVVFQDDCRTTPLVFFHGILVLAAARNISSRVGALTESSLRSLSHLNVWRSLGELSRKHELVLLEEIA